MGVKISKRYSSYKSVKRFETCPEFPPNGPPETMLGFLKI